MKRSQPSTRLDRRAGTDRRFADKPAGDDVRAASTSRARDELLQQARRRIVPHVKVEEKLHKAAGAQEITLAVTGVPEAKQGKRLVVLHTLPEERLQDVVRKLPQAGLPNLWLPRANCFFHVDQLPRLASGKMDLRRIRESDIRLAAEQEHEHQAAP